MNLEPNKNQTKLRKKAPTSSYIYLPPSHNLLTSSRGSISKEKILENIKKNNLHQNNFANASQLTNRSNINSKSKSSSRILSREHSQIKQKNCDKKENKFKNSNENLKIINDKAIEQPIIKNKKIFEKSNPPLNKKTISECFAASNHNQQHLSKKYIGTSQQSIIVNSANLKINSKQINKKNSSTKTIRQISAADVINI